MGGQYHSRMASLLLGLQRVYHTIRIPQESHVVGICKGYNDEKHQQLFWDTMGYPFFRQSHWAMGHPRLHLVASWLEVGLTRPDQH